MNASRINLKGRFAVAASLAAAALLAGGLTATPAAASSTSALAGTCEFSRTLCLFEGTGYTGARFTAQSLVPPAGVCVDLTAHGWGSGRAHSAINTATQIATLWTNTNCTGTPLPIYPGSYPSISFNAGSVFVY
ncbi:peptidase inhibitor family I36 protein [Sphaerisporangium sp. NPDC005288]|uniref:peptidase inhibitor family I36 protein n=1 Tax=Sphaerisporangium sp. NPDC005288 TaxID=3155114 RepID=UPI0033A6A4FD